MWAWVLSVVVLGYPPLQNDGLVIEPTDVTVGVQQVDLREPLIARTPDAKLVLFVRDLDTTLDSAGERVTGFEQSLPPGSVRATLSNGDGEALVLEHTDYVYYKGFSGLVLTETAPGNRNTRYSQLALESSTALPAVRFIWLDRRARTVRDVPPPR